MLKQSKTAAQEVHSRYINMLESSAERRSKQYKVPRERNKREMSKPRHLRNASSPKSPSMASTPSRLFKPYSNKKGNET